VKGDVCTPIPCFLKICVENLIVWLDNKNTNTKSVTNEKKIGKKRIGTRSIKRVLQKCSNPKFFSVYNGVYKIENLITIPAQFPKIQEGESKYTYTLTVRVFFGFLAAFFLFFSIFHTIKFQSMCVI